MDINLAKQTLESAIKMRTDELGAIQLAHEILTTTFKADFTAKDNATAEADDLSAKLNAEKVKTESLVSEKETIASDLEAERTEHNVTKELLADKEKELTGAQTIIEDTAGEDK